MTADRDAALRRRLSDADPVAPSVPVDPVTSPRARELLERIMQTVEEPTEVFHANRPCRWRRRATLAAAAAAVLAIGVGGAIVATHNGATSRTPPTKSATSTLALSVQGGISVGSCVPFDVKILRDMPVALAGTVTVADPGSVTLKVDHWYKGGNADQVTIAQPDPQSSVALDGVTFEKGKRYLLTATNGTVNGCGFSGAATPDLAKSYQQAFGE